VELKVGLRTSRGVVTLLIVSVSACLAPALAQAPAQPQSPQAQPAPVPPPKPAAAAKKPPAMPVKKVDLNNASLAELQTLPSVNEDYAKKIVAGRPYVSKTDLVTKGGLPEGVYLAVRGHVVVNDMKKAASKKPAPKQ
jgi:DNA uptake protein ComE-like DNA-binding protein